MCRLLAYLGPPILVDELLLKPENSLIHQSYQAQEMPEPLNGDGFGLGWYNFSIRLEPALFHSITPAWNNQNLRYNASMIQSTCLAAHIRAATVGNVSENNCHPFVFGANLLMHNGGVPDFWRIKREIRRRLNDDHYHWIKGETDTEHLFAYLIQLVRERYPVGAVSNPAIFETFQELFAEVEDLKQQAGIEEASIFNMVVTDGHRMVATRYSSEPEQDHRSLHYSVGGHFYTEDGNCKAAPLGESEEKAVLIVSERLDDDYHQWLEVPQNHAVLVDTERNIELRAF